MTQLDSPKKELDSPKKELITTLEAAWKLMNAPEPPGVRLAMLRGLVDHARALALKVGETSRVRSTPPRPKPNPEQGTPL